MFWTVVMTVVMTVVVSEVHTKFYSLLVWMDRVSLCYVDELFIVRGPHISSLIHLPPRLFVADGVLHLSRYTFNHCVDIIDLSLYIRIAGSLVGSLDNNMGKIRYYLLIIYR